MPIPALDNRDADRPTDQASTGALCDLWAQSAHRIITLSKNRPVEDRQLRRDHRLASEASTTTESFAWRPPIGRVAGRSFYVCQVAIFGA